MSKVLIIGSGISGLACAITCASKGMNVILVSPFPSERSQSVLAAGGINAVLTGEDGDSIEQHIEDTLKGGCFIAGEKAVTGLCSAAPDIVRWLESLGTVFSRDNEGNISRRSFGGQTYPRTNYAGAVTGKQIVTALVMEARRLEGMNLIERRYWNDLYGVLIRDKVCYGALLYSEAARTVEAVTADAVVIATGGQNALFGKTTGSTMCDGYAAGKLFSQSVELKNLEFIQYHPTTIETDQKKMLISEAARGEGGRLFYEEGGRRIYFMEDLYGAGGNLMPRDIVSRHIFETGRQVYLDVSFLGRNKIMDRIPEVYELCLKYRNIDISESPVPVVPSVHFFMGGIAVDLKHRTNIKNLYAIGECASMYHGANRLGGNSLLAAIYSGRVAAGDINGMETDPYDWNKEVSEANDLLEKKRRSESKFPVMYVRGMLSDTINSSMGIVRNKERLESGIKDVDYYLSISDKINFDRSELEYFTYSLEGILTLAKAALISAASRHESRGSHIRSDYPEKSEEFKASTIISYDDGKYTSRLVKEDEYEG